MKKYLLGIGAAAIAALVVGAAVNTLSRKPCPEERRQDRRR